MYIMFTITLERMLNIMLEFYKKKMLISNIDYLLRERHMTASQLEELIGVSNGYLSRLAVNDSEPGIDVVCTIARYLHIALEELMCLNLVKRSEKEEKVITLLEKMIDDTISDKMYWDKFTAKEFMSEAKNERRDKCDSKKIIISYGEYYDEETNMIVKNPYYNSPVTMYSNDETLSDYVFLGNLAHTNIYVTIAKVTDTVKNVFFYDLYITDKDSTEIVLSTYKASEEIKEMFKSLIENIYNSIDGVYLKADIAKAIDEFNIFA